jgi:hypothetical protein
MKIAPPALSRGQRFLFVAALVAALAVPLYLAGFLGGNPQGELSTEIARVPETAAKARLLAAEDLSVTQEAPAKYVTGSITNTSGQKFSYLTVRIILYDSDGQRVGTTGDSIQNFEPDRTWKFQAVILSDVPVASARVSDIEGW